MSKKVIVIGAGPSGKTPWYKEEEMMFHKARRGTFGVFYQIEKFAKQEPTPYRNVTLKDIEKFLNKAQSDLEKKGVFDPFDNSYLTPQNRKDINKAMVEYQKSQEYNFGKIRRAGWNNPKFSKTPTIDIPDSKSKYHK